MKVVVALLLLAACAPPTSLPPPIPLAEGQRVEVGLQGTYIDNVGASRLRPPAPELFHGQLSLSFRVGKRIQLSTVNSMAGMQSLWAHGLVMRYRIAPDARDVWNLHFEGGLAWGGVGFTWAREVGPIWVYTAPALLSKDTLWARLPAGARVRLHDRLFLSSEAGLTTSTARILPSHPDGPMSFAYVAVNLSVGL
jgi:hypothetical protein